MTLQTSHTYSKNHLVALEGHHFLKCLDRDWWHGFQSTTMAQLPSEIHMRWEINLWQDCLQASVQDRAFLIGDLIWELNWSIVMVLEVFFLRSQINHRWYWTPHTRMLGDCIWIVSHVSPKFGMFGYLVYIQLFAINLLYMVMSQAWVGQTFTTPPWSEVEPWEGMRYTNITIVEHGYCLKNLTPKLASNPPN